MTAAIERARWKEGALQVCLPVAARAARVAAAATSTSKLTPRGWLGLFRWPSRCSSTLARHSCVSPSSDRTARDFASARFGGWRVVMTTRRSSRRAAERAFRARLRTRASGGASPPNPRCGGRVPSRGLLAACDLLPSLEESGELLGCHCQPAAEALADLGARRSGRSQAGFCERAKAHMLD
jgi:hypothetical protein